MKEFMEDDPEALALIRYVVHKEVHLPVALPACLHNRIRHSDTGGGGIPDYLKLDYRTYPQQIKDFFRKVLNRFK